MKHLTKLTALLLCLSLLLGMTACGAKPVETTPPTAAPTEAPTEPPATDIYAASVAALNAASDISLEVLITTLTDIIGDEFSEQSAQTLTYKGIGTADAVIVMDEQITQSVHNDQEVTEDEKAEPISYKETWVGGNVYAELQSTYRYFGSVDAETAASRYIPVVLLNAELYGSVTSESTADGTLITFTQPTAAESWAMPETGELTEASGTVLIGMDGTIDQMTYVISYTYGPAKITKTVESKPMDQPKAVPNPAPANPDSYSPISYIDALRMSVTVPGMLSQADDITANGVESLMSQAAGIMRNQSTSINMSGRRADTKVKLESSVYFMDYSTRKSEEYDLEQVFQDGKLTVTENKGLPSTRTFAWEDIRSQTGSQILTGMVSMDFWEDITATDMGSVLLLEYKLNDNFGNTIQNTICEMLWNDPSFLLKLSSKYENTDLNAYLAVDEYTGLPVSAGYYYEGVHTIEKQDYTLSLQYDQSYEAPSIGAYQEITEEMPEETEPETKATPLFYHVTGEDGQEMWLLGTIHVGDVRTGFLPKEIYDAFVASDALALECDTEAFDEQLEEDDKLSEEVSNHYFYSDGTTIESLMEAEEYAEAVRLMKATGNYNMNMPYAKPYLWSSSIDNFYLRQGYQLHRDMGVESRLHDWAEELDKEIREVESNIFQVKMLTGFSKDLQLLMLEEAMETDGRESWESTYELYELWCAGDEAALREELSDEVDTSEMTEEELAEYEEQKHLIEEYNKAMSYDRNKGMLKVAIDYLESGDVVFYAVGLAHLLNNVNGLVDALRDAGYTVELVSYAG